MKNRTTSPTFLPPSSAVAEELDQAMEMLLRVRRTIEGLPAQTENATVRSGLAAAAKSFGAVLSNVERARVAASLEAIEERIGEPAARLSLTA